MRKLLIHADDLGLTEATNEGIFEAYQEGVLTSASLMANGDAFEHAVGLAREYPNLDLGVHLTLVEEPPVLPIECVGTLVKGENFHSHAKDFVKKYYLGQIDFAEIRLELDAQIRKILQAGIVISHLDSHQHLHMLPKILPIVIDLARHYQIPFIRLPRERFHLGMLVNTPGLGRLVQMMILNFYCELGQSLKFSRTDHCCGFLFSGNLTKANFMRLLQWLPRDGVCELMCHPGREDSQTRYAHWGYHPQEELNALKEPEIRRWIENQGIQRVSYRDL